MRRGPGHHGPRALDSSGPNIKIRGSANQIFEKYQALARDANVSGDRVMAENYLQHAEHYYRILNPNGSGQKPPQPSPHPIGETVGEEGDTADDKAQEDGAEEALP